jgi:hypothetical protein
LFSARLRIKALYFALPGFGKPFGHFFFFGTLILFSIWYNKDK